MGKRGYYRGFKRVSGAHIGALAVKVYVCNGCDIKLDPWDGNKKPGQCKYCGRIDILTFDSTGEHQRWATLCLLENQGIISNIKRQVRFELLAAKTTNDRIVPIKVGVYVADFTYDRDGKNVIEDFKGDAIDPLASWKIRHMEAQGLPVKLTKG